MDANAPITSKRARQSGNEGMEVSWIAPVSRGAGAAPVRRRAVVAARRADTAPAKRV